MKIVKFTVAVASFAMLPAAYAFASPSDGITAAASPIGAQILAMSDGGVGGAGGAGWTPFPEKDRTAKPDVSSTKEPAARAEAAAKKKSKERK